VAALLLPFESLISGGKIITAFGFSTESAMKSDTYKALFRVCSNGNISKFYLVIFGFFWLFGIWLRRE
jgi:hypothetical protein